MPASAVIGEIDADLDAEIDYPAIMADPLAAIVH